VTDGAVSFAAFVFAMGAVNGMRPQPNTADVSVPVLTGLFFQVAAAEGVARAANEAPGARTANGMPAGSIRFEGVSFRYPGTDRDVLCELDLDLRAGERTALVGANGAGKTTIVKLLGRLYEPTAGSITIDGVPLSELSPDAWRGQLAVLFQDFVRYELPARDNISLGAVHLGADDELLLDDATRAGAGKVVADLPAGLATPLSPRFTGGTDLSGGEWQRVALARALHAMRGGARLLVLDEPTANLDVRAEAELYDRFLELTSSAADEDHVPTTLLVSHRFSTVRQADRIIVLDGGRVVEDGPHDRLLALGGRYATMFRAQAGRFDQTDGDDEDPDAATTTGVVG
jgi:ATP-binding cassette subfamily B protein